MPFVAFFIIGIHVVSCLIKIFENVAEESRKATAHYRRKRKRRWSDGDLSGGFRHRGHRVRIDPGKIAKGLKGRVVTHPISQSKETLIEFQNGSTRFRLFVRDKWKAVSVRLVATWPDRTFRMRIVPDRHSGLSPKILSNSSDIVVGDHELDEAFVVQSNSPELARQSLSPKSCRRIIGHRMYSNRRVTVQAYNGSIEIGGMSNRVVANTQVVAIAKHFVLIYRAMLDSFLAEGIIELKVSETRVSTCSVCGDSVKANEATCSYCGVRYHFDCWRYIGKCSTYGCHSRKFNSHKAH